MHVFRFWLGYYGLNLCMWNTNQAIKALNPFAYKVDDSKSPVLEEKEGEDRGCQRKALVCTPSRSSAAQGRRIGGGMWLYSAGPAGSAYVRRQLPPDVAMGMPSIV